jgi:DNA-binding Lrp family transcriptional regulator
MISKKVIERFIAQINPSILGYKTICNFVIRNDMLNRDLLERISLVGDIHYQFYVMGGVEGFIMMVNDGSEEKIELLLNRLSYNKTISMQSKNGDVGDRKKYFNILSNCASTN